MNVNHAPIDVNGFLRLLALSVTDPRLAASTLMSFGFSRAILWQALIVVTILSVLLVSVTQGPTIEMPLMNREPVFVTPIAYAVILGACLVMLVFAIDMTGRALGGTGDFADGLALVVWIEVLGIALSLAQTILMLLSPGLAAVLALIGLGLSLWIMLNFVDVLHGFESLAKSMLTLVLATVGIILGLAVILAVIGVSIPGGGLDV